MRWMPVSREEFDRVVSSNQTTPLNPSDWAKVVPPIPGVVRAYSVREDSATTVSSDGTSVTGVIGRMDVLREDAGLIKAYRYLYAEGEGEFFRLGPFKDLDYLHHRNDLPGWAVREPEFREEGKIEGGSGFSRGG